MCRECYHHYQAGYSARGTGVCFYHIKFSTFLSSFTSNLQSLCISIEELSYSISDIQARIFGECMLATLHSLWLSCSPEIQEFRHKSQSSSDNVNTTSTIDQSLVAMDEKLSSLETGIKSITETLNLPLNSSMTAVPSTAGGFDDRAIIVRKHTALLTGWETVQKEIQVLREELKEDKWLTVFRTVTDQADGMMSSLEKAVNRCQDFIWQVHRKGIGSTEDPHTMSQASLASLRRIDNRGTTFEFFSLLSDSYEAKKKWVSISFGIEFDLNSWNKALHASYFEGPRHHW